MRGEIVICHNRGLWLYDSDHREGRLVQDPSLPVVAFGLELADFTRAVLDGETPAAGADYSLGEVRTALAIYRSVASGQWQKVW